MFLKTFYSLCTSEKKSEDFSNHGVDISLNTQSLEMAGTQQRPGQLKMISVSCAVGLYHMAWGLMFWAQSVD